MATAPDWLVIQLRRCASDWRLYAARRDCIVFGDVLEIGRQANCVLLQLHSGVDESDEVDMRKRYSTSAGLVESRKDVILDNDVDDEIQYSLWNIPIAESITLTFAAIDLILNLKVEPSNEGMAAELASTWIT